MDAGLNLCSQGFLDEQNEEKVEQDGAGSNQDDVDNEDGEEGPWNGSWVKREIRTRGNGKQ